MTRELEALTLVDGHSIRYSDRDPRIPEPLFTVDDYAYEKSDYDIDTEATLLYPIQKLLNDLAQHTSYILTVDERSMLQDLAKRFDKRFVKLFVSESTNMTKEGIHEPVRLTMRSEVWTVNSLFSHIVQPVASLDDCTVWSEALKKEGK